MNEEQIREKASIAYMKWLSETHPEVIENEDEYEEYSNGLVEGWYGGYESNKEPEEEKVYEGIKLEPRPLPTEKDNTYNGANCLRCKWLDKSRTYKWQENTLYVCKRKELTNKANARKYNEEEWQHIPSDLKTDGYLLGYAWKCENKEIDEDLKPYLNELEF